jgi:hypothetical protein
MKQVEDIRILFKWCGYRPEYPRIVWGV